MADRRMKIVFLCKDSGMVPLGFAYLMGQLGRDRYDKTFMPVSTDKQGHLELPAAFHDLRPDAACFSVITGFEEMYLALSREVKKAFDGRTVTIFGGPHITFNPETLEEQGVDAICRGEGDECLAKFLDEYWEGDRDISTLKVEGMSTRFNITPPVLVEDLDKVAIPDREAIYERLPQYRKKTAVSMLAGRGCPFNCSYCFNSANHQLFKGRKFVRNRSPIRIIEEMIKVREIQHVRVVRFMDDVFPTKADFLEEFATLREKLIPDIIFTANFRVEVLRPDIIPLLKKAGCTGAVCAVECSNEKVRRQILNRHMTNEKIRDVFVALRTHGIRVMSQNMVGVPGTTLADDYETLAFNQALRPQYAWCSICQPYYRTQLYEHARRLDYEVERNTTDFCRATNIKITNATERNFLQKSFSFATYYRVPLAWLKWIARLYRAVEKAPFLGAIVRSESDFFYVYNEIYFLKHFVENSEPQRPGAYALSFAIAHARREWQRLLNLFRPFFGFAKTTRFIKQTDSF